MTGLVTDKGLFLAMPTGISTTTLLPAALARWIFILRYGVTFCERNIYMVHKTPLEQRFLKYVNKKSDNDCWEWIGSCDSKGYGKILDEGGAVNGKLLAAHRVSYE